jgi:hypothetical protein
MEILFFCGDVSAKPSRATVLFSKKFLKRKKSRLTFFLIPYKL